MVNTASRWTHTASTVPTECLEISPWQDDWNTGIIKLVRDSELVKQFNKELGEDCTKLQDEITKHLYGPKGKANRGFYKAFDNVSQVQKFQKWMDESALKPKALDLATYRPHTVTQRTMTVRSGPQCTPFFGHAMWIIAKAEMVVGLVELTQVVDKLSLKTLEKLPELFEERAMTRLKFPVAKLQTDDAIYIPFGTLPFPTSDKSDDLISFVVLPWMDASLAEGTDSEVVGLVNQCMQKFMKSQTENKVWKEINKAIVNRGVID